MTDIEDQQETRTIEIPERTAATVSRRLDRTEFESVDAYVTFALELLIHALHRQDEGGHDSAEEGNSPENTDAESVESRLESLGYL